MIKKLTWLQKRDIRIILDIEIGGSSRGDDFQTIELFEFIENIINKN